MESASRFSALAISPMIPVLIAGFTAAIFLIDTVTPFGMAVAVLYVVVVLLAASCYQRRGIQYVAVACVALTVLSYLLSHGEVYVGEALARCFMSLSAIGITTFLVLKNQSADMALRERARLLDLTHDTIVVRDMNDVVTYWNRSAEDLYGWRREEAVGKVSHELMQTVFPAPLKEITAALEHTGRWEGELVQTRRDGTRMVVASRWSLQRDERGRPVATLESNNDITERKRAEEALHQARADLAHAARVTTLGELAASIAHEVNQPLTAIVTNGGTSLRWLGREPPDLDEARAAVQRIISDANRATEVIRGLRAFSKKAAPQMRPVEINDVVDEVLLLIQRELLRHRVTTRTEFASALPPVLGDRVQLQQVIINLIMNGIDAMTSVTERARELVVRSKLSEDDQVVVSVEDTGTGIEPENMDRLFNAFFTTKSSGMGIGLSICRSIIEAHGGRLRASANEGPGATFEFSLPPARENG